MHRKQLLKLYQEANKKYVESSVFKPHGFEFEIYGGRDPFYQETLAMFQDHFEFIPPEFMNRNHYMLWETDYDRLSIKHYDRHDPVYIIDQWAIPDGCVV
jgi:hypothetical protein